MSASKEPYGEMSLLDFQKYFPDEAHCWEYVVRLRWPKGKSCPGCHQAMGLRSKPAGFFNAIVAGSKSRRVQERCFIRAVFLCRSGSGRFI